MNFTGTPGGDDLVGTSGNDDFDLSQGGNDDANGLEGNDIFRMGAAFTAADSINGGDANDTLELDGDYGAGVAFGANSIQNIERILLTVGYDYSLTTHDSNVAAGEWLNVVGTHLGAGDNLTFDGSAEINGHFFVVGGAGDDVITGGTKKDGFSLRMGGTDIVDGGAGIDTFKMVGALDAADQIDGGAGGRDKLILDGDYSGANALVCTATTISNIERVTLQGGSFDITLANGTAPATGRAMYWEFDTAAGQDVTLDASADLTGKYYFFTGQGDDIVTGSAGRDTFEFNDGSDKFYGGGARDTFISHIEGRLESSDRIDGGAGDDTLILTGYEDPLHFTGTVLTSVESLVLDTNHTYDVTVDDDVVASGKTLALTLGGTATVNFDGSDETDGTFRLAGGNFADVLKGGALADRLEGGSYNDTLTGGGGADVFAYSTGFHSTGGDVHDTITDLNADTDKFDLPVTVTALGTASGEVNSGAIFDGNIEFIIGDGNLAAGQAMIVTATSGDLAGHVYLVVADTPDGNYNFGDYLIDITGYSGTLDTGDFI